MSDKKENTPNDENSKNENTPMPYSDLKAIAKDFHESGFFQSIKNPQQALVTIMAGREMGMGPFEAMSNVYVIQGRPAYYAHKYGDMIKRTGKYNFKVEKLTETECVIDFTENGKSMGKSEFTMEDAKKAGLSGTSWTKYPRNMLYARAMSNGARWYCPDAFNGAAYEPSELGAEVVYDEQGTQTVISVPDEDIVVKEATTTSEPVETSTETENEQQDNLLEIDHETSRAGVVVTQASDFEIGSFTERQSANGNPMGSMSIISNYTLPAGVVARWDEYTVSPFVFQDKIDMYRGLEAGDKVLAKLIFENKGDKNYQNIDVVMKYPKDNE
jgi:hypothetical protein